MKPSAEDWENQELDKLLFEYLEGNLPEEQARELEQQAASEALVGTELEYWKETKVTAEFYDTSLLEEKLLRIEGIPVNQPVEAGKSYKAPFYVLIWLICMCCVWPVRLKEEKTNLPAIITFETFSREKEKQLVPISGHINDAMAVANKLQTQKKVLPEYTPTYTKVDRVYLPDLNKLNPVQLPVFPAIQEINIPASASKKLRLIKVPASKTATRKQARQIARMKERSLQRRMANEFLKGRVPYVVPLNTQNF